MNRIISYIVMILVIMLIVLLGGFELLIVAFYGLFYPSPSHKYMVALLDGLSTASKCFHAERKKLKAEVEE